MNATRCPRCPYPHAETEACPPVWNAVQADGGDSEARERWDWAMIPILFAFALVVVGVPFGLVWTLLWLIWAVAR